MINWSKAVQPLLGGPISSPPCGFTPKDLEEVIHAVNENSLQILDHDSDHECFYSSYMALVGHQVANSFDIIQKSMFREFVSACAVIMEFCLRRLQKFDVHCAVPQKNLMQLVSALCLGGSPFVRVDVITFTAMLKSAKPVNLVDESKAESDKKIDETSTATPDFITEMTKTFKLYSSGNPIESSGRIINRTIILKENVATLSRLIKIYSMDEIYKNLSYLKRYINRLSDLKQGKALVLPDSASAAMTIRNGLGPLSSNISIILQAVSLPTIESMTSEKIENLSKLGLSCIYAGISVVAAMTISSDSKPTVPATTSNKGKEPDYESIADNILCEVFEIFLKVEEIFGSTYCPPHVLPNFQMMAVYIISQGLAIILQQQEDIFKDSSQHGKKKVNNLFTLSLAVALVGILEKILQNMEQDSNQSISDVSSPEVLNIFSPNTSMTRLAAITEKCDILPMLVRLVHSHFLEEFSGLENTSFCTKYLQASSDLAADDSGASDDDSLAQTYDNQNSENEFSSCDDDVPNGSFGFSGGPILGEWFLRILNGQDDESSNETTQFSVDLTDASMEAKFKLPDEAIITKDPAHQFLQKASINDFLGMIVNLLNVNFLSSKLKHVQTYVFEHLKQDSIVHLVNLVKMSDVYEKNSRRLMSLLHNLLSSSMINERIETAVLTALDVDIPAKQLFAHPKSLSILFKILFRHQVHDTKEGKDHQGTLDFITSMIEYYRNPEISEDGCIKSIDIIVIQMGLFLFHTLTNDAKRKIFKSAIHSLAACQEDDKIPIATSRLVMLLEYFMHHYSRPSAYLFSHLQHNLVTAHLEQDNFESTRKGLIDFDIEDLSKKYLSFLPAWEENEVLRTPGMPTSDAIPESNDISLSERSELLYEVSDIGLDDAQLEGIFPVLELDPVALQVLKSCDVEVADLYKMIVSALNAGSKLRFVDSGKEISEKKLLTKSFLVYNFQITWRLAKKVLPLLDGSIENCDLEQNSLSYFLALAFAIGKSLSSESDDRKRKEKIEKLTDLFTRLVLMHTEPESEECDIVSGANFPTFTHIMTLDCVLHELLRAIDTDDKQELLPDMFTVVMKILHYYSNICRSYVLLSSGESEVSLPLYSSVMQADVIKLDLVDQGSLNFPSFPNALQEEIMRWDAAVRMKIPDRGIECGTEKVLHHHLKALNDKNSCLKSLQYVTESIHMILAKISPWDKLENKPSDVFSTRALFCLLTDTLMSKFADTKSMDADKTTEKYRETICYHALNKSYQFIVNVKEGSKICERKYSLSFVTFLEKLLNKTDTASTKKAFYHFFISAKNSVDLRIKKDPKSLMTSYEGINLQYSGELVSLLLSVSSQPQICNQATFSLVCKMFDGATGENPDLHLAAIISELDKLQLMSADDFEKWLTHFTNSMLFSRLEDSSVSLKLVSYLTHPESPVNHNLALKILESSILELEKHIKSEPVTDFLTMVMTLAEANQGQGHSKLFQSSLKWLDQCRNELVIGSKLTELSPEQINLINVCELLLLYTMDVLLVLHGMKSEEQFDTYEDDDVVIHSDELQEASMEKQAVKTTSEYDMDEDEDMCNKLCTYTVTQKEFMNQHWYHCHTCDMTEGIGVCTICAKVCHRGHDLAYAKYGSFFCDCGAKGNKACRALTKRDRTIENHARVLSASSSSTTIVPSASSSVLSVKTKKPVSAGSSNLSVNSANEGVGASHTQKHDLGKKQQQPKRMKLCKNLDGCRDDIFKYLETEDGQEKSTGLLLNIIADIEKIVGSEEYRRIIPNSMAYALKVMTKLHEDEKKNETVETLLVPTLGSQEGAFENVKANFTGEQGQTIRQLINTRMIYRVAMSCLSSGFGRRHHLAVSHEKNKLTILQLSALLKQADSSKRKLTLTRLSTTLLPFTLVTLSNNPCNEEVLAVCGLKDCHILTFTSSGLVNEHLILHPQLTAGNYIIKCIWLPGSSKEIALITAKFIKIYDLSKDVLAPIFHFLLPTGKVRDATFMTPTIDEESTPWLIIMSSSGYMYDQPLYEHCSAAHGPFYVTGTLAITDDSLTEKNDLVGGGGISVYYSHVLQLLFFSYGNGRNFAATLDLKDEKAIKLFPITFKGSNGKMNNGSSLALYAWSEVTSHPGLLTCFTHSTGLPIAVMVDPEKIQLQEMKTTTSKAKIQDLVAVRHSSPGEMDRSTIIALCEDGSLRIYLANQETTGFWLESNLQPGSVFNRTLHDIGKKGSQKGTRVDSAKSKDSNQVEPVFPVDFFEDCQLIPSNDLEFGGDSLLQVYNPNQIKNRLANQDMYIVSKKTFLLEVTIKNKNMIVTGIRMQVGHRGGNFVPTHIYIGERYISLGERLKKSRWFDFPLTREESINFRNKLLITCGSSTHADDYNIVDSVKLYGKTKEAFGWQEEDVKAATMADAQEKAKALTGGKSEKKSEGQGKEKESNKPLFHQTTDSKHSSPVDKLLLACIGSLNCTFGNSSKVENVDEKYKSRILDLSSKLLVQAVPHTIHHQVKKLMMNAFPTIEEYHKFKDNTMLKHISETLESLKSTNKETPDVEKTDSTDWNISPDVYQVLLMELSRIAVRRPSNLISTAGVSQLVTASSALVSDHYCTHMQDLLQILMQMIKKKPKHRLLSPPCLPGIQHVESSVQAYIDIVHSVAMTMPSMLEKASKIYFDLLTSEHVQVSSAAKSALIRLLYHPLAGHSKPRSVRSNSKSSDTAPSTRSNSPPTTMSSQAVATSSGSGGVLVLTSNQSGQVFPPSSSYISSQGAVESMNDDDDDEDDDDDDSDGDEFDDDDDDDDGPLDEVMMMEEDSNGIAPSLHRDEQLRAMQELEENMNQAQMAAAASGNDENGNNAGSSQSQQGNVSQMQNEMQRLQEIMQAENANNFFNQEDNSSLEEMIMDVQEEEYPDFDAEDEAMVELAIALSLQQSGGSQQPSSNVNNNDEAQGEAALAELMHSMGEEVPVLPQLNDSLENEQNASETQHVIEPEEESQRALINTQADAGTSSITPESQAQDSKHEDRDVMQEAKQGTTVEESLSLIEVSFDKEKVENMRCSLLDEFIQRLPEILKLENAERSIPYFQVLVTLTKLLDPKKESQRVLLEKVVSQLVCNVDAVRHLKISEKTALSEMIGHIIRCLDILMSKTRSHSGHSEHEVSLQHEVAEDDIASRPLSISSITAKILVEQETVHLCIKILHDMLEEHWGLNLDKNRTEGTSLAKLLKPVNTAPVPDYTPIISSQYVKAYVSDIYETYPEIMTERLLHLLCRFKKYYDSEKMVIPEKLQHHFVPIPPSEGTFCWILSDYMLSTDIPVIKKFVRKALFYLCGSKESYKEVRDAHALSRYIKNITKTWMQADVLSKFGTVNFPYDQLISIVKYLGACSAIATKRTGNWQKFCLTLNQNCLEFLLELSIYITEDVATSVLELLICAVSIKKEKKEQKKTGKTILTSGQQAATESKNTSTDRSICSTEMAVKLSQKFLSEIKEKDLRTFLIRFLLEINTTSVRWNAHEFVLQLFRNNDLELRTKLVNAMWLLWPLIPNFGRKAVQFVDLLGYLSIENGLDPNKSELFTDAAFGMLKRQNLLLTNHPNSMLYTQLLNYVDFDGYFLESNPCLICNQPEVPYSSIKLASVKSDTKFTTTQQIIKLVGSYSLQKVTVKITDIKQTKMIRTVTLLYNNKKVPAIIELKNKPELWNKAKQVVLMQGQTEAKFDLPLPVIATNLMLEFSDFYENVSATTETLQCPRCSASVQANPGICGNCGENVFQCHKCRSINYDEKDPFLCNVCGFSKHAKFDITLYAKPCCAVDTIDNEEARKKTVGIVSVLLEKADLAYYQMLAYKPDLEQLLLQIEKLTTETSRSSTKLPISSGSVTQAANTAGPSRVPVLSNQPVGTLAGGAAALAAASHGVGVNVHIRHLAQKYCIEAKNSFEELSKIMKTVLASRKEIVEYDQRQRIALTGGRNFGKEKLQNVSTSATASSTKNCYGCAAATAKQCIVLLRALATDKTSRKRLLDNGLITELVHVSLRRGNVTTRKQVQQLIGQLVKNDQEATIELNTILFSRLSAAMLHHNQDLFPATITAEMNLLASIQHLRDNCWQLRLRTVVQLFQMSVKMQSPAVVENITLPCLKILQSKATLTVPPASSKLIDAAKNSKEITVSAQAWLAGEKEQEFAVWKVQKIKCHVVKDMDDLSKAPKTDIRNIYLMEKYVRIWRKFVIARKSERMEIPKKVPGLPHHRWLRQMLFCKSSRAVRQAACLIVKSVAENNSRKGMVIDMLTSYLDELSSAGEAASEFFQMYKDLIQDRQWKVHLASQDILPFIGRLIDREIANLMKLEETTLMLDLQQGYSLKELTELLSELVHVPYIRQCYKGSLVGTVLNGYLSMRKLVIQRTSIIDDTQELLLELLEDLTTGTELETKAFMAVCIKTINKYELSDIRTPQFIFERLANIIFPEENNTNEFFMSLDKDPLQEDFLQGRMVGNPYSSTESGLGPLMRDVKNKICRDCDLVALLEDDNGMELLVNNKIISLDLPVRDVYNKVWLQSHAEDEAMRVVYRMRGLLGEATEDIIDKLDPEVDARDEEEVYKMSSVLSQCGGIEAMLQRLDSVQNLTHGRQLVDAIMKLMTYIVRLKSNRKYLMRSELNTLNVLLGTLNLGLQSGEDGVPLIEQLLQVMDRVLQETSDDKTEVFTGDKEKLTQLLQQIDSELVRHHSKILRGLMRIIPFLSFGDPDLMQMLIDHFKSALDFEKFDENHTDEDAIYLDCFCEISTGIEDNENGDQLKDLIINNDIVSSALAYISQYVPQHKKFESEDWKAFVSRPALPYCLRLLAGLSAKHNLTQLIIGETSIPDLHRLEQVSTQESIGSLAENVLEAISANPEVSKNIKEVRRETRAEKKRLAMAVRKKELGALGMKTNAKGQVVTQTPLLKQIGDLVEESGLTCIICREGYKFEPKKVLGVYTFSRRCTLEEFENKPRKQQGYSTVSHFNVVHYDCHTSAVRAARGREEWESAMLQNANTKCNGLLPLWGPHVSESSFATCLARHNTYIQDATGYKEPNVTSTVHDLKLLFLRFANEKSFSEETGGGGPQSNIHIIPYMMHMAQYVINTTRSSAREERNVSIFLEAPKESWVETSYSVDGPLYIAALSVFVCDTTKWMTNRLLFLKRLLVLCQTRQSSASIITKLTDRTVKSYDTYKPFFLFWAMIDLIYTELLKHAPKVESADTWAHALQVYIRNNDVALQETTEKTMLRFQQDFLPIASLEEFVDVADIHADIEGSIQSFMTELFESLPK